MDLVYPPVIAAGHVLFRALGLRIMLTGTEHLPDEGPVVIAANHVSFLDFALVGLVGRSQRRYVRFLARHDVWHHPVARPLMTGMRHIPVDRAAPAAAYLRARSMLRSGEVVGIFPEAGVSTSYTVRSLMPGAVALAAETGAPIVPVAIWGPQRIYSVHQPRDLTRGRPVSLAVGPVRTVTYGADLTEETRKLGRSLQTMLSGLQELPEHRPRPGEIAPWHPAHLGGHAPSIGDARTTESLPTSAIRHDAV